MKHFLRRPLQRLQRGLTLVELLVAMALMGFVTLATVSLYSVTSSSYKTVDAGQQLDDNARFIFELVGQALRIAGYQEYVPSHEDSTLLGGKIYPAANCQASVPALCPVLGFNNARVISASNASDYGVNNNGGFNFSDTLAVTFSGSSSPTQVLEPDGSMVDCQGIAKAAPQNNNASSLGLSLFWVTQSSGEPELACISYSNTLVRNSQVVVRGVETFQVVYGLDTDADSLPNRWVSAQNVANWMQVRAVRVGFILRGAVGSSQSSSAVATQNDYYPLGRDFLDPASETGLKFTAPEDGRMRRAYVSTFMLRNSF